MSLNVLCNWSRVGESFLWRYEFINGKVGTAVFVRFYEEVMTGQNFYALQGPKFWSARPSAVLARRPARVLLARIYVISSPHLRG